MRFTIIDPIPGHRGLLTIDTQFVPGMLTMNGEEVEALRESTQHDPKPLSYSQTRFPLLMLEEDKSKFMEACSGVPVVFPGQPPLETSPKMAHRIDEYTAAEKVIWDAVQEVERAGAHPRLTDAVILLGHALQAVSDFVDSVPKKALPGSNEIAPERLAESRSAYEQPSNHRFRKRFRKLNPQEEALSDLIKDKANDLADLVDSIEDGTNRGQVAKSVGREKAIAQTHLEEFVMRAVRAITA